MADFAVSAAGSLIELIGNEIIQQICETWGYESELEDLKETVSAIKDVLVDADHERAKRELTNQERGYIMKLKDAVYDAEDLFDEFLTLSELKQIKTLSKVQMFFTKELELEGNEQLSTTEDDEEPWKSYLQNLRSLEFRKLPKMTSLPKGMQSLTSLQTLQIGSCENMKCLPEWISCLSSLHSLTIKDCPTMKSLPEAISNLTSLKHLQISDCPELYNRLEKSDGVDFSKIQHIPRRDIY